MPTLVRTSAPAEAVNEGAPQTYSFSLILSAEPSDDAAELLYARCSDITLGLRSGVPYAAFDRMAGSLPMAIDSAIRDVEQTLPSLRVVRVEPDELVSAADIARRTSRSRASVSQLVEGHRGPGNFPSPRAAVGGKPVWDWLDVANWFSSKYQGAPHDVRSAAFLSALNGALCIRRVALHLEGDEERHVLAKLIQQDAALLGLTASKGDWWTDKSWLSEHSEVPQKHSGPGKNSREAPSAANVQRIVAPHPAGGWSVLSPGAERASARTPTKREAEARAKEIVRKLGGGRIQVHTRDGRVHELDAFLSGHIATGGTRSK